MAHPSTSKAEPNTAHKDTAQPAVNQPTGATDAPALSATTQPAEKQRFSSLLLSLLAAAIGVQSSANREKDFRQGRVLTYIIAGSVGTALFILGLVSLVQFILKNAS